MRKKHFTLIELLVVIAIIAVLAGMLLPSLSKAKEQGKLSVCLNNLKTMGLGNTMYANDNQDYIVPGKWGGSEVTFCRVLANYGCDWKESYVDRHRTQGTFACPSEPRRFGWGDLEYSHSHYVANGYLCGWNNQASSYPDAGVRRKMNHVSAPSIALLISDSGDSGNAATLWRSMLGYRHKGGRPSEQTSPYYKNTMSGATNVVYIDGHCEVLKYPVVQELNTTPADNFFKRGIKL